VAEHRLTLPLESEIQVFVLRHLVRTSVVVLNVTSALKLWPRVSFADGPWALISEMFWIQRARAGVVPSSFADVAQLHWLQ
jgi:hypothetical protein